MTNKTAGSSWSFGSRERSSPASSPFCHHYVITSFFFPEIRKPRTTLVPPILRPEILAARASRGDHLLVTRPPRATQAWLAPMRRGIKEEQVEGNLRYRPFDESAFIEETSPRPAP